MQRQPGKSLGNYGDRPRSQGKKRQFIHEKPKFCALVFSTFRRRLGTVLIRQACRLLGNGAGRTGDRRSRWWLASRGGGQSGAVICPTRSPRPATNRPAECCWWSELRVEASLVSPMSPVSLASHSHSVLLLRRCSQWRAGWDLCAKCAEYFLFLLK